MMRNPYEPEGTEEIQCLILGRNGTKEHRTEDQG
jgi:hypothetical protein